MDSWPYQEECWVCGSNPDPERECDRCSYAIDAALIGRGWRKVGIGPPFTANVAWTPKHVLTVWDLPLLGIEVIAHGSYWASPAWFPILSWAYGENVLAGLVDLMVSRPMPTAKIVAAWNLGGQDMSGWAAVLNLWEAP